MADPESRPGTARPRRDYTDYPEPNPEHDPGGGQERTLLDLLAAEGRANPYLIRTRTGWRGQRVQDLLQPLVAANWVVRVKTYNPEARGFEGVRALYQYNADGVYTPRPLYASLPTPRGTAVVTVDELADDIATIEDPGTIREIRAREEAGPNRVSAKRVIAARLEELGEPVPEDPIADP